MADKYLKHASGAIVEVEASASSAGAGDAGKIPALDGAGRLSQTMMPVGVMAETASIEASENLAAGDFVNIHDSTGAKVRKADASNGRRADGFVLASVTSGQNAVVFFEGANTSLSGMTPGATMYLSASSAGAATATPPSGSGHMVQEIGRAYSATAATFEPTKPITLA